MSDAPHDRSPPLYLDPDRSGGTPDLSFLCLILERFPITLLPPAEALSAAEGEESRTFPLFVSF